MQREEEEQEEEKQKKKETQLNLIKLNSVITTVWNNNQGMK